MHRELREIITETVYEHLAEHGTFSKVVNSDGTQQPLSEFLNKLCDPLIEDLLAEIGKAE